MTYSAILEATMKLSAVCNMAGIWTDRMVILLPPREFWNLYTLFCREHPEQWRVFDGRGPQPHEFVCCGITFRVKA